MTPRFRTPYAYAGVFLVSQAVLVLEIVLTRILSVTGWYHLAFFVISLAMLGMTFGAILVFTRPDLFPEKDLGRRLQSSASSFAVSTPLATAFALAVPLATIKGLMDFVALFAVGSILAVPFALSGITLALALTRSPLPTGTVYALDLLGAASGAALVIPALTWLDAPSVTLLVGAIAALGAVAFGFAAGHARSSAWILSAVLALTGIANARAASPPFRPEWVKGRRDAVEQWIYTGWNSHSRVTVSRSFFGPPGFWGKGERTPAGALAPVEQRVILIDGEAGTLMTHTTDPLRQLSFLEWDVTSAVHALRPHGPAAVIGVGGGRDVLAARVAGHEHVVGIELNGLIVDLHQKRMPEFSGLSRLGGVELVRDEARSYLARDPRRYSVIAMSLVDTWAATGAGAYSLSENGLYTVEAWQGFLERLEPHGILSVSRGYYAASLAETARLVALALGTAWASGATRPRDQILVLQSEHIATLLLGRSPFSVSDVVGAEQTATQHGFHVVWSPVRLPEHPALRALWMLPTRSALHNWTAHHRLDLEPPTDERPFFFNMLRPNAWFEKPADSDPTEPATLGNLQATQTLLYATSTSVLLTLLSIVVPLRRARSALTGLPRDEVLALFVYFALIGLGFMCVEMGFLSRLSIFLGHPTLALSVLLGGMICFTGAGSLLSARVDVRRPSWVRAFPLAPALLILLVWLGSPPLLWTLRAAATPARIGLSLALVGVPALGLGLCFPLGLQLAASLEGATESRRAALGPWLWGINGAFGVCGTSLGLVLSMTRGISATLLLGALCYLILPLFTFPIARAAPAAANPSP